MGKPGRPKKEAEPQQPALKEEALEFGYYTQSNEWIQHLSEVFGEPTQIIGATMTPPSVYEGVVFFLPRPGRHNPDIFSDSDMIYINIRRLRTKAQGFRVEVRAQEYGLPYEWVSDKIKYIRIDRTGTVVSFFDSFEEWDSPVVSISKDAQLRPSIQSLSGKSSVR